MDKKMIELGKTVIEGRKVLIARISHDKRLIEELESGRRIMFRTHSVVTPGHGGGYSDPATAHEASIEGLKKSISRAMARYKYLSRLYHKLPDEEKCAVKCLCVKGYTKEYTAQKLGVTEKQAVIRMNRGLERLGRLAAELTKGDRPQMDN